MEKNVTLEDLLMKALQKLKKEEFYEEYLQVLLGAWYTTVPELKLALSDGDAWSDIQLPGRLKLEMKRMIIGMDQKEMGEEGMTPSSSSSSSSSAGGHTWIRCYAAEHNAYYYCHPVHLTTQWELPNGESYEDDISVLALHTEGREGGGPEAGVEGRDDLLPLARGASDNSDEYLSPTGRPHQNFIITEEGRRSSPLEEQFYSNSTSELGRGDEI